ncbi:MAG: carbohydrate binding family 9 domain-containing protein [Mariniphaga sp.]|nr:carbohydrate binding family 9 domain-containing protein [Mariniphaga sp.]
MKINKIIYSGFLVIVFTLISNISFGQKQLNANQLTVPITIDGIFESNSWAGADSAISFIQMEPQSGNSATEQTIAWFGYDNEYIYSVIKCYQSTPLIAKNQSRDALSKNDDAVAILIDTYNDNRSGYGFMVNPLGTQIDFKINDDGRNLDINWDTEWECEAKEFNGGWCVEIKIPFKSLKFKSNKDTWGINFGRVIRSNFETVYWSGALSDDFRISQGGKLTGIIVPGSEMSLKIFPYLSVFKTTNKKLSADVGGDVQWQISSNVSLNATINPDFATVEADQVKVNLSRYELRYPEKRLFFQEGNDMYSTRIRTFYSRRIQDIDFGERLNGKIGNYQFNVLNVKTADLGTENPSAFFTAAKIKRDIFNSSSIGLALVDKSWDDGYTRSVSLDYVLNLGKTWQLTGQFVGSAPGNFLEHSAWFARFARENNIYHYHFRYNYVGEKFQENVNQTGFITDDDRKEIDFEGTYKFWVKNSWLEYIDIGSNNNIFWSNSGTLRSWNLDNQAELYFSNKLSFEYNYNNEYKLYEKEFHNFRHEFSAGYNTEEWSHTVIGYTTGKNFDRNFSLLNAGGRIKLFENLSLTYTANLLHFSPDPENSSTFINIFTANYNFTKDLWLKMFVQNSTSDDKIYVYGMLGWRFKPPFGALYLIYSHDEFQQEGISVLSDNLFLKLTYPISLFN